MGDVAMEDRELRRAMAKASLRESWRHATDVGLEQVSEEEIDAEIHRVRNTRQRRKAG
jgi:hypothetical protein